MHVRAPVVFDVQNMFLLSWASPTVYFEFNFLSLRVPPHAREVVLVLKRILHIFHQMRVQQYKMGGKLWGQGSLSCQPLLFVSWKYVW